MKRRQFLKNSGAFITATPMAYQLFSQLMVQNFIQTAVAEAQTASTSLNYINIFIPGAPMRFVFDHWLKTSDSEPALSFNGMTGDNYQSANGIVIGTTNKGFQYKGWTLPYLFSQSVNVSAGSRSISDLLDSMLVIRGFGTGFDGHAFNGAAQMAPLGGAPSLNGLVADNSKKVFEAIQSPNRGGYHAFTSKTGKAVNILPISNPLPTLLEGFKKPGNLLARNLKESQSMAFEEAKSKLRRYASLDSKSSEILNTNLANAEKMIKKGIGDLSGYWNEALPRYKNIIKAAITTPNITGINDVDIISDESVLWNFQSDAVYTLAKDFNLKNALINAEISLLAEGLAMTEYALSEDLAQSIEIFSGSLDKINILIKTLVNNIAGTEAKTLIHSNDMHGTGSMSSLVLMNSYYRGFCAGLIELITKLKAKNIWNKTLIQVSSEFGRSARTDLSGSDHGFNQMVTSIFSGAFSEGPYLVGNISKSGLSSGYSGSQGLGVEINNYNQKGRPTPLMAASTIAQLLNVETNPYVNLAAPLVKNKNGVLVYEFGKGKLVDV